MHHQAAQPTHQHLRRSEYEVDPPLDNTSLRVLTAVQAPLERLLGIRELPLNEPLLPLRPVLVVNFPQHPSGKRQQRNMSKYGLSVRCIAIALQAISELLVHSVRLRTARFGVRRAFWMQIFSSRLMSEPLSQPDHVLKWMLDQSDDFPSRIDLAFDDMNKSQMDAVRKFFTRGNKPRALAGSAARQTFVWSEPQDKLEQKAFSKCQLGLSFTNCNPSVSCLRSIQQLLDQVSIQDPSTGRHCGFYMLDLSSNNLDVPQLEIIAEILSKNHVYNLTEIKLDEAKGDYYWYKRVGSSHLKLKRAAFGVPEGYQGAVESIRSQSPRHSISFTINKLEVDQVAAICSALRYGCAYEELSLVSLLGKSWYSGNEKCWAWIAFGLFYPRSKRFASSSRLRKIDLSGVTLGLAAMVAFAKTLANPVAGYLLERYEKSYPSSPEDKVLVCDLLPGATIYSSANGTSKPLLTLDSEQTWEVLYGPGDTGWLNVVVPGYGLGRVRAEQVGRRRPSVLVETKQLGLVMDGPNTQNEWYRYVPIPAFNIFMKRIGKQVASLELQGGSGWKLNSVVDHCSDLERLNVAKSDLNPTYMREMLAALRDGFGRQLKSLNLNRTGIIDEHVRVLTEVLKTPGCLPKLRELQLWNDSVTEEGLTFLSSALETNNTIVVVELRDSYAKEVRDRFNEKFDNTNIGITSLPMRTKLAIISATANAAGARAGNTLDRWFFEQIFEFVGQPVRRNVLWTR